MAWQYKQANFYCCNNILIWGIISEKVKVFIGMHSNKMILFNNVNKGIKFSFLLEGKNWAGYERRRKTEDDKEAKRLIKSNLRKRCTLWWKNSYRRHNERDTRKSVCPIDLCFEEELEGKGELGRRIRKTKKKKGEKEGRADEELEISGKPLIQSWR